MATTRRSVSRTGIEVANTGDRPVQVGSHYHFFETNDGLVFDRAAARGRRLDIPAGTAVRFEPGQSRTVRLVAETVSTLNRPRVDLPVGNVEPALTAADIDAAVQEVELIIGAPVTLRRERPDISLLVTQRQLAQALQIEFVENSETTIDLSLDPPGVSVDSWRWPS